MSQTFTRPDGSTWTCHNPHHVHLWAPVPWCPPAWLTACAAPPQDPRR